MFNNELRSDVKKLKEQVYGRSKETKTPQNYVEYYNSIFRWSWSDVTLKEQVDRLEKVLDKHEARFELLLKHLNIEYHKLTDENGSTTIKEEYRKRKKVKPSKKRRHYEDED